MPPSYDRRAFDALVPATCALALSLPAVAQVTSVAIPATADASIYVLDGWGCGAMVLDRANGAGQYIAASYDDCTDEHHAFGLIRFDVAGALPAGATIVSARVDLFAVQYTPSSCCAMFLHAMHSDWSEGPSDPPGFEGAGVPPQPGDVTYVHSSHPTPWTVSPWIGQPIEATRFYGPPWPPAVWTLGPTPALASRVQTWLDQPQTDFGWLIRGHDQVILASRQNGTLAGPILHVDYLPPPCAAPTSYCIAAPNSHGPGATLGSTGSTSLALNDFAITVSGGVPSSIGFAFFGDAQQQTPFGNGFVCVTGTVFRLLPTVSFTSAGTAVKPVDFTAGAAQVIAPGSTWNFQFKYRDVAAGGALFNYSNGLSATFCP